jgi:hypothetical protein
VLREAVRKPRQSFDYAKTTRIENVCQPASTKTENGETADGLPERA